MHDNEKLKKFCLRVWCVCKRPGMFTKDGTFGEAMAFISGMNAGYGIAEGSEGPLAGFGEWLKLKRGIDTEVDWVQSMLSISKLEDVDFAIFIGWFHEFIQDEHGLDKDQYLVKFDPRHLLYGL